MPDTDKWPPIGQKMTASMRGDSWTGNYFDNNTMEPAHWFDQSQTTCGPYNRCWDDIGADSSRLSIYIGHGAYPDKIPSPQAFRVFNVPHMTLWFPQKRQYLGPNGAINVCGVRLADPVAPQLDFDTWLGGGSGGMATHLMFLSSCTAQPRLVDQFLTLNRASQIMGFMGSPLVLPGDQATATLAAEALNIFYLDTLHVSNVDSWLVNFGTVQREGGGYAGAIVHTFSPYDNAELLATDGNQTLPPSKSAQHMLRAGQQIDRQLPLVSPVNQSPPFATSVYTHQKFFDLCAQGNCGIPDPACTAGQPLSGTPTRIAGGSPSIYIPSGVTPTTGQATVPVVVKTPAPNPPQIAKAAVTLGQFMTHATHDTAVAEALVSDNVRVGDWRLGELSQGLFIGYDAARARLRLFYPAPPELRETDGSIRSVGWAGAETIIEDLLNGLIAAGLPSRQFWTTDAPLVSTISERINGGAIRDWGFQYTIFRKVNGVAIRAIPLTAIVHRSGAIVYLALSGKGVDTVGEPGDESSGLPGTPIFLTVDEARTRFIEFMNERGTGVIVHNVSVQYEPAKPETWACAGDHSCTLMTTTYVVVFSAESSASDGGVAGSAPPLRVGYVDATTGAAHAD